MIAWIFRFFKNAKRIDVCNTSEITFSEFDYAEKTVLKLIQMEKFEGAMDEKLRPLKPFLDEFGILRARTKLSFREDTILFPIILPNEHSVVHLMIVRKHEELMHAGVSILMNHLRENIWILRARKLIRQIIQKCTRCKRFLAQKTEVVPSSLPKDRVSNSKIFQVVGVELAGPLHLRDTRNRDYTGMWVRRGSTNLMAGKVVFLRGQWSPIRVVDLIVPGENVANLGKWSNAEKVTILKLKLAGIAEEFFLSDPTHSHLTEFNDIARVLISRFERTVPLSTRLQLFSSCIQGSPESVQEFAARINKLGTQIFHSSNTAQNTAVRNANDQLLQSRFISGLRNDIRRFVLARDPNNLEESINAALIEEQNVKLNQIANDERTGLSPLQTETSVISALTNKLEEINLSVERLQEASSVTARKTGGGLFRRRETVFKCYYCDLEGHKQAECTKRRAKERTLNYQPPCRNAAGEFSVFRQPNTHSFDRRHVHFQESAFRDNYAAPRHSANISQSTSRDRRDVVKIHF
ncbi:integrase catalytic domain-containing protein [Trichonephila clavipes]|uniref:Integrase catalytic domain-containing protein n=1 Tax=Trichonephila clavipes TaxID=2585209 RepID=A0A8X7BII1_TRICX|nr:integrase catalytic domain-containing protein [Trichonephila clavipes]